jgi:choline dehydrogenase-like flavoprotein
MSAGCDVAIVGGGTAGCVLGRNLADHPLATLVLPYRFDAEPAPLFQIVATLHSSGAHPATPRISRRSPSVPMSRPRTGHRRSCAVQRC